jgi:hypothetical protein
MCTPLLYTRSSRYTGYVQCRLVRTNDVVVDNNDDGAYSVFLSLSLSLSILLLAQLIDYDHASSLIVIDEKRINIGPNQL